MLRNFMKPAFEKLMHHKIGSVINIFGLFIGFTGCILISLFISHDYSFNLQEVKEDRINQLGVRCETKVNSSVPSGMAGAFRQNYPEIQETTNMLKLFRDD